MMNDYERRFQNSLQKLTVPTWYSNTSPSTSNILTNSQQSILSNKNIPWRNNSKESERTPEIIHVRGPRSYRSCRSSVGTSPSPSIHSWHPNHMIDGGNLSILPPSRRLNKYEKGIERVSRSSRWYQPTMFASHKIANHQTGTMKISPLNKYKQQSNKTNHYDTPKIHRNDDEILMVKSTCLVINGDLGNLINNEKNNTMITNNTRQDNHIEQNESQTMPLATRVELEELTDDDDDNRSLLMISNKSIPSITNLSLSLDQTYDNSLLERTANDLIESVLSDKLVVKNHDDDDDDDDEPDKNSGVRELSEDENGLRELDENDINDTDEFILFSTKLDIDDYDQTSNTPRSNHNHLYKFSKTNNNQIQNSAQITSDQNLTNDEKQTNLSNEKSVENIFSSNSQSSEGINEETARIGRLLLDSISSPLIENFHHFSNTSNNVQLILRNPLYIPSNEYDNYKFEKTNLSENKRSNIDEYEEELNDNIYHDSAYSSNQERINSQQYQYEPLFECYSGYSFLTGNISSLQSTTDEAYESEPTTMSSSIAATTYVHPDLVHEFEYPSPPPPVPDRRLKPCYLKVEPPSTKPRSQYATIEKIKPLSMNGLQQIVNAITNDSTLSTARTISSRHYCGSSIAATNYVTQSTINSTTTTIKKDKTKEKRYIRTFNCLHPSTGNDYSKKSTITNRKTKLHQDFDEATNGLAIRLPVSLTNGQNSINKDELEKTSSTIKQSKNRQNKNNIKSNRLHFYETSV